MLWFGTYGSGVSRFDGQSWVTFTTQNGLIDNTVLSIWAARDGSLWFGTLNGVSTYDGQYWRSFSIRTSGDPVADVGAITETPDGRLWFGSIHGALKSYFKGQWQIENISGVTALAVSPDGSLWVGTLESVLHWNNIAWESFPSEGQVSSIAVSPNGDVWVGYSLMDTLDMSREALDLTDYPFPQVSRYDGKEWVQLEPPAGLLEEDVRSIQVGPDGTVWFGSFSRGVVSYDGSVWHTLQIKNQQCSNFIQKLAVFQDEIWFGYPGGISHFDGQRWECLTQLGDLEIKQNPVFVIHIDPESGDVWAGTMKGLAIFNSTDWITYSSTQYPWLSAVAAIVSLPDNSFLIGSDEGVYQFDGEKWNALWAVQKSVETIQVAGDGSLWLGSTFGIYSSKGDNWKHFDQVSGTLSMATGIFRAPDGTLWIASCPEGLAQLVGNTWKVYSGEGGDLLGGCVLGLTIDQGGIVWAGTTVGLSKYNGEVWNTYQTQDGLANNYVQDVTVDSNGEIWVATIAGISHYSELKIGRSNFLENAPRRRK